MEIARITIASVTQDVTSVYARRGKSRIRRLPRSIGVRRKTNRSAAADLCRLHVAVGSEHRRVAQASTNPAPAGKSSSSRRDTTPWSARHAKSHKYYSTAHGNVGLVGDPMGWSVLVK